jgi:adenylyltransferase/sulfurtransferase
VRETDFACAPFASANSQASAKSAAAAGISNISASDLHKRLEGKGEVILLDVRTAEEYVLCNIPGALLIPLNDLPKQIDQLDRTKEIIVYCKSGARSRSASQILSQEGFTHITNLTGGILAWIAEVDPSMPGY